MTAFIRDWRVTVGTLRVGKPLRVAFEIERTLHAAPNKATVQIWNLTRDHQAQIEQAAEAQVVIETGYSSDRGLEQIFTGELHRARGRTAANGQPGIRSDAGRTDVVTHVEARDGGTAYQQARVAQSFGPGTRVATVLRALASAMGVGAGNVDDVADVAQLSTGSSTFPEGTVLSGQAARELTRILGALGLRWSVQHGALQVLRGGDALATEAVLLEASTGLIGMPEVGTRGRVKASSVLNTSLAPGRPVLLRSARVTGRYVVHDVKYRGDSHANEWVAECELRP